MALMDESEKPAKPMRVISSEVIRGQGVRALIQLLMRDHTHFKHLVAIAVVPTENPDFDDCRVYTTNLSHLEKLGLLEEAKKVL